MRSSTQTWRKTKYQPLHSLRSIDGVGRLLEVHAVSVVRSMPGSGCEGSGRRGAGSLGTPRRSIDGVGRLLEVHAVSVVRSMPGSGCEGSGRRGAGSLGTPRRQLVFSVVPFAIVGKRTTDSQRPLRAKEKKA
ncbi:UNVERIFIED_CONTAM: hypothetical protein FKN15_040868 [Acipenser sinensis]